MRKKETHEHDEVSVAEKLETYRKAQKWYRGPSFESISGVGANGAIIHYRAEKATCAKMDRKQMYLIDSGGQYSDGTTDVTRTLHFGEPTDYERECYTRVLKGHISIDSLVFPPGTTGYQLDCVARLALWRAGLNYRHGTGHGVGHFLNVHEGALYERSIVVQHLPTRLIVVQHLPVRFIVVQHLPIHSGLSANRY